MFWLPWKCSICHLCSLGKSCLFKLNLHFPEVCLCPPAGGRTSYGILSLMLIDASYASCKVALSSKKYEELSAKFLKEWKILKQRNDVQF